MKIIADIGNPDYFERRAIECIYEAKNHDYDDNIRAAIQLLVLARETRDDGKREVHEVVDGLH